MARYFKVIEIEEKEFGRETMEELEDNDALIVSVGGDIYVAVDEQEEEEIIIPLDCFKMEENKIYCEHCGKEIDPMRDYDNLQIDMGHKWYNTDLCIECLDKLYDIVINFCKKQDHPTEEGSGE